MGESQRINDFEESSISSLRTARRPSSTASKASALRAERYRKAEAFLAQSLLNCKNEPSPQELQLRTLEQAMDMLAQFTAETGQQVKELVSVTSGHPNVANLDPVSYQALLSQRWKLQYQEALISQKMKIVQQAITSLTPTASDAGGSLLLDEHEDRVSHPKHRAYTNLMSFLCCPQRVAPLHRRPRSCLPRFHLKPLHLDASAAIPLTITPPPQLSMQLTTTYTSSDTSLDMCVQTPVVTDSPVEQQAHFMIDDEEAGTATILTQLLPSLTPPDPSDVKVELPDYVHKLLADFDASHHDLAPSGATLRFKSNETRKTEARKRRFWPFRRMSQDQGPRSVASQPELRSKSSFRRLSELMSTSEASTPRRTNTRGEEPKTGISEVDSRDESNSSARSPTSSNKVIGRMASNIARRISFANLRA